MDNAKAFYTKKLAILKGLRARIATAQASLVDLSAHEETAPGADFGDFYAIGDDLDAALAEVDWLVDAVEVLV